MEFKVRGVVFQSRHASFLVLHVVILVSRLVCLGSNKNFNLQVSVESMINTLTCLKYPFGHDNFSEIICFGFEMEILEFFKPSQYLYQCKAQKLF